MMNQNLKGSMIICVLKIVVRRENWKDGSLTHILQCSNGRAKLLEEERVIGLSTAKVDDLDDIHVSDNDVLWLDV